MVQLLLNAGALEDDGFRRAVELAEGEEHFAVADLLRQYVAGCGIAADGVVDAMEDVLSLEWSNREGVSGGDQGTGASRVSLPEGEQLVGEERNLWPEDCWERFTGADGFIEEEYY